MKQISYIIPSKGRVNLLKWHLGELNRQISNAFEVIVVFDEPEIPRNFTEGNYNYPLTVICSGGGGPAATRNAGAQIAQNDVLMFVGDDVIPDPGLILRHLWWHILGYEVAQGYTPWHPDVVSRFTDFIDVSGLQANWAALKKDNKWISEISASFCLTTNYSISKRLFNLAGGFDERFTGAAWEDVEFGHRVGKFSINARFDSLAKNYHYHRYNLDSFVRRSYMEGTHRYVICERHPEMTSSLIKPSFLREAAALDLDFIIEKSKPFQYIDMKEVAYERFFEACRAASFKGAADSLAKEDNRPMRYLLNVSDDSPEQCIEIVAGTAAIKRGNFSYARHCAEWLINDTRGRGMAFGFAGEVELAAGDKLNAIRMFDRALAANPDDENAKERLKELA